MESLKTKIVFPEEFALLDQDWEFIVADASRLDELMQAYVELELNVEEKFTLMMIIAESYNDLLSACVIDPEELEPLRQILIKDFVIHKEGIRYWAYTLKDGDKPEEAFPIAFLMKDILESQMLMRTNNIPFVIQAGSPRSWDRIDDDEESLGDAIEEVFMLHSEDAILRWNGISLSLGYKYDVSLLVEDLLPIIEELQSRTSGEIANHWVSNTFAHNWIFKWTGDRLTIHSEWDKEMAEEKRKKKKTG